ncbi:Rossmann-like and DUF2520 domain-containing protein [Phytomonospora endophytica]|uniref:Putative short-subunit dehydrogenase-like oxidoreductase (DUF2520 family) n=1 Tax=Phytomonospora endophytica TaxID=714109 RepID=A0A841FU11_9ACTN|nr:DUF2520 domain-containing protein [Phytomonospora endophytica]MBB6039835.1 putative short-subunit dehydrogenase-like oxidoreductase (DUF2520 family) [Phytomonospora endophytica]GIG70311.1 hypothetical protein Pen01_66060 [Phytomonospora endophytica]
MPNAAPNAARLTVGVISAGRVGSVLGAALARAGHHVIAATAVSDASRARAERLIPQAELAPAERVADLAELLILAVPDDTLPGLVQGLADTGHFAPGRIVAHVSGSHGIGVLEPATAHGALALALHPVMTFTGRGEDLERLSGISFGVTAPEPARVIAEALVVEMGGEPEFIREEHRALYHAGLTHGANHLVTLVNEACDVLRAAGVLMPERMIAPLLSAALDNTLRLGDAALTGPVSRGDVGTVAAHLDALVAEAPDSVAAYVALARRTADRAIDNHRLTPEAAEPLLGVLADRPQEKSS